MVEWKKLGESAFYYRGVTYNKKQEVSLNSGGTKILRANNITLENNSINYDDVKEIDSSVKIRDNQWLYPEDILICAGSGSKEHVGKVAFVNKELGYAYGGFMGKIVTKQNLKSRYLFHILCGQLFKDYLNIALNSTTINNLNSEIINNFLIPIPSLQEQERIVGILDTFTASIDNLKAQIEQRRKQYEHYRDQLLDLEGKEGVEMKTLGEIANFSQGIQVPIEEQFLSNENGYLRFLRIIDYTQGKEPPRYVSISDKRYYVEKDDIAMVRYGTPGFVCVGLSGIIANNLFKISIIDSHYIKKNYLSSFLKSSYFQLQIQGKSSGGALSAISFSLIKNIPIPIPSLQEQERIVGILDTFEASIKNLEAQLEQRQKQYEYYREKLLTFER